MYASDFEPGQALLEQQPRFRRRALTSLHRAGGFWDRGRGRGRWRFAASVRRSTVLLVRRPVFRISVKSQSFPITNMSETSTVGSCTTYMYSECSVQLVRI